MTSQIKTIIIPVKEISQAKALYREYLGVDPYADESYYVGFRIDDQEIGLDPNGHALGLTGPTLYTKVEDIKKSLQALVDAGAQVQQEARDVGGGRLIASVKDADGNDIGLFQDTA